MPTRSYRPRFIYPIYKWNQNIGLIMLTATPQNGWYFFFHTIHSYFYLFKDPDSEETNFASLSQIELKKVCMSDLIYMLGTKI